MRPRRLSRHVIVGSGARSDAASSATGEELHLGVAQWNTDLQSTLKNRDKRKALGGERSREREVWFVQAGNDLGPFRHWLGMKWNDWPNIRMERN